MDEKIEASPAHFQSSGKLPVSHASKLLAMLLLAFNPPQYQPGALPGPSSPLGVGYHSRVGEMNMREVKGKKITWSQGKRNGNWHHKGKDHKSWAKRTKAGEYNLDYLLNRKLRIGRKIIDTTMGQLSMKQVVEGEVMSFSDFGAFVDIGLEKLALLHIKEISSDFISPEDLKALIPKGTMIKAMIKSMDYEKEAVGLSTRALETNRGDMISNPSMVFEQAGEKGEKYLKISEQLRWGEVVEGEVANSNEWGVFVDIGLPQKALLHRNEVSSESIRPEDLNALLPVGSKVRALIRGINDADGSVYLSTEVLEPNPGDMINEPEKVFEQAFEMGESYRNQLATGSLVEGVVAEVHPFGAFIKVERLANKNWLLLPNVMISKRHVSDATEVLSTGSKIKAVVNSMRDFNKGKTLYTLCTNVLEPNPGDMIKNPDIVFEQAEEMGELFRKHLRWGEVVEGQVMFVDKFVAWVEVGFAQPAQLHISEVSADHIQDLHHVLDAGTQIKAMVSYVNETDGIVSLSTNVLEPEIGDMVTNPDVVYEKAEKMGEIFRKRMKPGNIVQGEVVEIQRYGVFIDVMMGKPAFLPYEDISAANFGNARKVFDEGQVVKALITSIEKGRIQLNTKVLEPNPGDMVNNQDIVFEQAEEMGELYRAEMERQRAASVPPGWSTEVKKTKSGKKADKEDELDKEEMLTSAQ